MPAWNESYSVCVLRMDQHHQRLLDLLNRVNRAMGKKYSLEATEEVLEDALNYARSHFAAEEKMLERYRYPDIEAHKAEHEKFIAHIQKLQVNHKSGDPTVAIAAGSYLAQWFINHIRNTDMQYSHYFKSHHISPEVTADS